MESAFIDEIAQIVKGRNIQIRTIADLGACDLDESLYMSATFPDAFVFSFEANPEKWEKCSSRATDKIKFTGAAIGAENGDVKFHIATDPMQSSVYDISPDRFKNLLGMDVYHRATRSVPMIRLDSIFREPPDLIFMDIQNSEQDALIGLGALFGGVSVVATELMLKSTYATEPNFDAVDLMLKDKFDLVRGNPFEGVFDNFIYVNKRAK